MEDCEKRAVQPWLRHRSLMRMYATRVAHFGARFLMPRRSRWCRLVVDGNHTVPMHHAPLKSEDIL